MFFFCLYFFFIFPINPNFYKYLIIPIISIHPKSLKFSLIFKSLKQFSQTISIIIMLILQEYRQQPKLQL